MEHYDSYWLDLFVLHFNTFTPDKWMALFGVSPQIVSVLWSEIPNFEKEQFALRPVHLLWTLHWLRIYNTWEACSALWRVNEKTVRRHVKAVMRLLNQYLDLIHWEHRLDDGPPLFDLGYVIVDATLCPIEVNRKNWHQQKLFFSAKHGKHGLKYEIGVHWRTGRIVWLAGGVRGPVHDITLVRRGGLLQLLQENEHAFGDKGYVGEPQLILARSKDALKP